MYFHFKKIVGILFFYISSFFVNAQNIGFTEHNEFSIRQEKLQFDQDKFHSNIKAYHNLLDSNADSISNLLNINTSGEFLNRLLNTNLISINKERSSFYIDPIISIMPEFEIGEGKAYNNYLLGLSFSGLIKQKLEFRLNGFSGMRSYPEQQELMVDSTGNLPFIGNYLSKRDKNYLFYSFTGHLSYSPYQFLNFCLGREKHFLGDGYRTLFLSDNSAPFPYFKTTVDVWHFKYLWLFGVLSDRNPVFEDEKYRKKFLVAHYLSYNATRWLNLSFFEALISNPTDSAGLFHLNPAYLNPAIFYRPVEFASGSTDNMIMGLSFKVKILKKYQIYGQFLIDEFIISEIRSDSAWWGNKYGFQAGLKVFNLFGIKNLFSRIEYNQVRPYTYSYYNSFSNFGNRFQPLAHPLGANFKEIILEGHYHSKRFSVGARFITAKTGTDADPISFGQDIYKSSVLRPGDYHIMQGQGQRGLYSELQLRINWIVNPKIGLSIFAEGRVQNYKNFNYYSDTKYISFGISSSLIDQKHYGF